MSGRNPVEITEFEPMSIEYESLIFHVIILIMEL